VTKLTANVARTKIVVRIARDSHKMMQ
jgi:hypothetical protein